MPRRALRSVATISVSPVWPPWLLKIRSLRRPARWTPSPTAVQTRMSVAASSDRVPGKARCSCEVPTACVGRMITGRSFGSSVQAAAMTPSLMMTSVASGRWGPCCSTAATGRMATAFASAPSAKSVVVSSAHCTGNSGKPDTFRADLATTRRPAYVTRSVQQTGFDSDPVGVLSMFIDRLDEEEEQPEKPETKPQVDERPSNLIDANLFRSRTVLLFGEINDKVARMVTAQLVALSAESDKPIRMFINSPGGHVESGDTIFDVIRFVRAPVQVIGTGWVASAGALIYVAAKKENRFALPNTRFMLHQPSGGTMGRATDIAIEAKEIIRMRQRLNETFARETGQPLEKVIRDTERNYWMSAEEAVTYGLASRVINLATEID